MTFYDPTSVAAWSAFIFFGSFIQLVQPKSRPWYEKLKEKSSLLPKDNSIFSLWSLLYLLIFFSTITYFHFHPALPDKTEGLTEAILWLSWANILLNHLWSPMFFYYGRIAIALVILLGVTATSLVIVVLFGYQAAYATDITEWTYFALYLPYPLWLIFALSLNVNVLELIGNEVPKEDVELSLLIAQKPKGL